MSDSTVVSPRCFYCGDHVGSVYHWDGSKSYHPRCGPTPSEVERLTTELAQEREVSALLVQDVKDAENAMYKSRDAFAAERMAHLGGIFCAVGYLLDWENRAAACGLDALGRDAGAKMLAVVKAASRVNAVSGEATKAHPDHEALRLFYVALSDLHDAFIALVLPGTGNGGDNG